MPFFSSKTVKSFMSSPSTSGGGNHTNDGSSGITSYISTITNASGQPGGLGGLATNFMHSGASQMMPKLTTLSNANGENFMGVNSPLGKFGITMDKSGNVVFGRYQDPRQKLRDMRSNKVIVPPDYGTDSTKPVPTSRGGELSTVGLAYDTLKEKLLSSGELFEDLDFPATDSSLFNTQAPPRKITWLRPSEICSDPQFFSGGASRFDVQQGALGDCWLLAAIACLSMDKKLFAQVVPEQTFADKYCGMFKFNFWYFGQWKEVVVDDRLPCYNGELMYMHSADKNEFWSALLEKAYAKLCGCYEALKGGTTSEALEDFTGGISEMFDLKEKTPKDLLDILLRAQERGSLMACSIQADPNIVEAKLENGLIMGHAYSITAVRMLSVASAGKIPLLRVRNPWGNESEWLGAWSDKSREWQIISEDERQRLGLVFNDDGEFWMSFKDFISNFEKLEICHLGPQSLGGQDHHAAGHSHKWECIVEHNEWVRNVSAGGCRNFPDSFWINPQFSVTVVDADDDDDENKGTLIVGLMQKERRLELAKGGGLLTIGFAIYKLPDGHSGVLEKDFFLYNASTARSPNFINMREVCGRFRLEPGTYCIVPSTFKPNEEAKFLLRIFSEKPHSANEMDEKTGEGQPNVDPEFVPPPMTDQMVDGLRKAFDKVSGDDQEIDADELMDILNAAFKRDFAFEGFTRECARSMVSMMDYDRSGRLGFDEFKNLWELLRNWKTAFKKYDEDKSGNMNSYELRLALKAVGFGVSNTVFSGLVMRFASRDGSIAFDDFVICCARLRTCFESFKVCDRTPSGDAIFDEDTFLNVVTYV